MFQRLTINPTYRPDARMVAEVVAILESEAFSSALGDACSCMRGMITGLEHVLGGSEPRAAKGNLQTLQDYIRPYAVNPTRPAYETADLGQLRTSEAADGLFDPAIINTALFGTAVRHMDRAIELLIKGESERGVAAYGTSLQFIGATAAALENGFGDLNLGLKKR